MRLRPATPALCRWGVLIAAVIVITNAWGDEITFPGKTWEKRTPEQVGMDRTRLDALRGNLGKYGCIVRDGYLVYSWGDPTVKFRWASAAKPVHSTLLFFAVHEGKLASVDDPIQPFVQQVFGRDPIPKDQTITFRHLADMVSGYARAEAPGTAWAYNDWAISLYVQVLFRGVFGRNANEVATDPNRLGALQFEDGAIYGGGSGYGLETSPRDFARIGWFWLHKGNWNGRELLPRNYFDRYLKPDVPANLPRTRATDPNGDYLDAFIGGGGTDLIPAGPGIYGFNWWFNPGRQTWPDAPEDTFQANGHVNREVLTVIPSLRIVAAWKGTYDGVNDFAAKMNPHLKRLVGAVVESADTSPPSRPGGLSASAPSPTRIDLSWSPSSDPETGIFEYRVYRDGALLATTIDAAYRDSGLFDGKMYAYEVTAVNRAQLESPASESVYSTTGSAGDADPPAITVSRIQFDGTLDDPSVVMVTVDGSQAGLSAVGVSQGIFQGEATLGGTGATTAISATDASGNTVTRRLVVTQ